MHSDVASWNFGLLFASLCTLLGMIGVVSTRRSAARSHAIGYFMQGVTLLFVVGGAYFGRSAGFRLGGLVVLSLLILQMIFSGETVAEDPMSREDDSQ
jgi:hypothetical protein